MTLKLVDCLQPAIFSCFYSVVERAGRIMRKLDVSPKRRLHGAGVGTEIIREAQAVCKLILTIN